jgi:hypothetical protein
VPAYDASSGDPIAGIDADLDALVRDAIGGEDAKGKDQSSSGASSSVSLNGASLSGLSGPSTSSSYGYAKDGGIQGDVVDAVSLDASLALEMVAVVRGWVWTYEELVSKHVWPHFVKRAEGGHALMPVQGLVMVVRLLGTSNCSFDMVPTHYYGLCMSQDT